MEEPPSLDSGTRIPRKYPRANIDSEGVSAESINMSTLPPRRPSDEQESINASKPLMKGDSKPRRASWTMELIAWVFALLCFGALVGVLAAFDGESIPHWKHGITLGTIASIFTTFAGFGLMVPVTAALGQLKWMWFERERPLLDFKTFEDASRGPKGSLLLLWKRRGGVTATIGAILILLQIAVGPFVQQVIQTKEIQMNVANATIPVAISLSISTTNLVDIDLSMKAAIMNAALDIDADSDNFNVSPICPTGNCTWPAYQSLGFCGSCTDLTSSLTAGIIQNPNDEGYNWTLPNGLSLFVENFRARESLLSITINNTIDTSPTLNSLVVSQNQSLDALLDIFVIVGNSNYTEGEGQVGPFAAECLIQICVQSYEAQENKTIFQETVSKPPEILSQGLGTSAPYASGNFSYDAYAARSLQVYLSNAAFADNTFLQYDSLSSADVFDNNVIPQALFQALNNSAPHTLDKVFSNIAKSMTRNLRSPPSTTSSEVLPITSQVIGVATSLTPVIRIEWYWISLPALVIFAVLGFLIMVMWQARRRKVPNLKDSSLATLFYGLGSEVLREYRRGGMGLEMDEVAEKLSVRFRNDVNGWGLEKS